MTCLYRATLNDPLESSAGIIMFRHQTSTMSFSDFNILYCPLKLFSSLFPKVISVLLNNTVYHVHDCPLRQCVKKHTIHFSLICMFAKIDDQGDINVPFLYTITVNVHTMLCNSSLFSTCISTVRFFLK